MEGWLREFLAVAELSFKRCERDINAVINMYIGGAVAMAFFAICFIFHFIDFLNAFPELLYTDLSLGGAALYYAMTWAILNTFTMLTFIAFCVCLFEYTLSFCIVCYYYDNCSWMIPNATRKLFSTIAQNIKSHSDKIKLANAKEHEENVEDLKSNIAEIKKPSEL